MLPSEISQISLALNISGREMQANRSHLFVQFRLSINDTGYIDGLTAWSPGAIFLSVNSWVRMELLILYKVIDSVFFRLENIKYYTHYEN